MCLQVRGSNSIFEVVVTEQKTGKEILKRTGLSKKELFDFFVSYEKMLEEKGKTK